MITGGRYLLEGSLEARAKVTDDIGVVGFVDGGYVAADVFPALDDLRIGAGVGVRYYTGLGPLRLDVAVPLNKRAGDPDYAHLCRHRAGLLMAGCSHVQRFVSLVLCRPRRCRAALVAQDVLTMSNEEQKDWLTNFVQDRLSTPERQIRLSNIDGALGSDVSVREITISDAEGVWLRVNNAQLNWNQAALFLGRLEVRSLKADSIEYIRNAVPVEGAVDLPAPEAGRSRSAGISGGDHPAGAERSQGDVRRERVRAGLGDFAGRGADARWRQPRLPISISCGSTGRAARSISMWPIRKADNAIDLGLSLVEPENGVIANLLNIENRPAVTLTLDGQRAGDRPADRADAAGQWADGAVGAWRRSTSRRRALPWLPICAGRCRR